MRALFFALAVLIAFSALAVPPVLSAEIPSDASGRYATPEGECSAVFARAGVDHVNVDITCSGTFSHSTAFAYGGACPGAPGVAYVFPINGSSPSGWIAFDSLDGRDLNVRRGVNALQLYIGGGVAERWTRAADIASPSPYACGAAAPPAASPPTVWGAINQRMRDLVCRVNPGAASCGR